MIIDQISEAGSSAWLDDLSRAKITGTDNHSLPYRIAHNGIVGVTTNPNIFNIAISQGSEYAASMAELKGKSAEEVVRILTTDDVRNACDLFTSVFESTNGKDGRVSIEVDPRLARDTAGSIRQGKELWEIVGRPNVLIKIPATLEGLGAITQLTADGININVTLIFSVERYIQVFHAYMEGLELRLAAGEAISNIRSVASLFVSRMDTAVDALLKAKNSPKSLDLLGKAAIANAALTYKAFEAERATPRWQRLQEQGANVQRPLWASTGVKDPAYDDTRYVIELVAPDTVNTMPQATLDALLDHGIFTGKTISSLYVDSQKVFRELGEVGISLSHVSDDLETDAVKKFEVAWIDLIANVERVLTQ